MMNLYDLFVECTYQSYATALKIYLFVSILHNEDISYIYKFVIFLAL